jgi:hypothetical protein
VISERQKLMATQIKIRRHQRKEQQQQQPNEGNEGNGQQEKGEEDEEMKMAPIMPVDSVSDLGGSTTLPKFESTMSWPDLQNYGNKV